MTSARAGAYAGMIAAALWGAMAAGALAQQAPEVSNVEAQNRGFYVGAGVGPNIQEDNRFTGGGADSTATYDLGYVGVLSLGYALGNGLRFEIEPGYRRNDADKIDGISASGHTTVMTFMANAIYDLNFRVPFLQQWLPHVGVGAGAARILNHTAPHAGFLVGQNDTVPAFQAIAGLEYAWSPAVKVGVDYRYLLAHDASFKVAATGASTRAGDFNDHAVLLTLRYEFGAPGRPRPEPAAAVTPPPPPPAPAPRPPEPQAYTLYFDNDSAALTGSARTVVQRAAATARESQITHINVTGYTDTTGSARHNEELSRRRAEAVRAELIRDGVPADEIVTIGRGESQLAVPTAQAAREPRNRRVVIILQPSGA